MGACPDAVGWLDSVWAGQGQPAFRRSRGLSRASRSAGTAPRRSGLPPAGAAEAGIHEQVVGEDSQRTRSFGRSGAGMTSSVKTRAEIVELFRRDLIGPGPQDADLAAERLNE